ncbi:MAG TPA: T9SS type A sorting domain-containing protein, partial [Flavobacterium sp.]|nr:T9SS type A sorting domain-containing protein [Flavobacterium sp.]
GNILGPENICPNSTATFNLAAGVPHATSYTWTVPNGWKVNGITGPVVTGQGTSVQITSPTSGYGNYSIKLNAVSTTCGTSPQVSRAQKLDYPIELSAGPPDDYAEFTVMPHDQNSYTWTLPTGWRKIYQQYNEIFCDTRGIAGTIYVNVLTLCNRTITAQKYFDPNANLNTSMSQESEVYPNPVRSELIIPDVTESSVLILNSSGTVLKQVDVNQSDKKINLSDLNPGTYYLKYSSNNKEKMKRIMKE